MSVVRQFSCNADPSEHIGTPMKKRSRKAFWGGFWGGIAAPLALFSNYSAPTVQEPQINPLYRPARSSNDALRSDVRRIGDDFGRSIARHNGSR